MLKYSFIEHPLYYLLRTLDTIVPNVQKAYVLFADNSKKINLYSYTEKEKLDLRNKKHLIQKIRAEKRNTSWMRADMLEFINDGKRKNKIQQLSLTDENENNILCLKFISPYDDLYDVLYIELNQSNLLQFVKEGKEFTTSEKSLVATILYNAIKSRVESEYKNLNTHALIINSFNNQQSKIRGSFEENERLKRNYEQTFNYFLNSIAKEIKQKEQIKLNYSPTCISYIATLTSNLDVIRASILRAVSIAQNLHLGQLKQLTLEPEHIEIVQPKETQTKTGYYNKHQNVIDMLDKYEVAAIELSEKGMKVNGANVAQQCTPSITPAAISFNLKKYAHVILLLIEKHDTKWNTIKNQFKPLMNIIEKNKGDSKSKIA